MYFTHSTDGGKTVVCLHGEIDHHTAKIVRTEIDELLESVRPKALILDLSDIVFCDSSGLGLIMGRYKKITLMGGILLICNPSPAVTKILNLSGMDKLIKEHL